MDFDKKLAQGLEIFEVFKHVKEMSDEVKNASKARKEEEVALAKAKEAFKDLQKFQLEAEAAVREAEAAYKQVKLGIAASLDQEKVKAAEIKAEGEKAYAALIAKAQKEAADLVAAGEAQKQLIVASINELKDKLKLVEKTYAVAAAQANAKEKQLAELNEALDKTKAQMKALLG